MGNFEFSERDNKLNTFKRKYRILFLFAHLHKGGMQRAVSNISLALPDDFEQFVGFYGTENPGFQYNAHLHDFNLPGSGGIGIVKKIANIWKRITATRKFVLNNKIDVVISFGENANLYNIISHHAGKKIISSRVDLKESLREFGISKFILFGLVRLFYPKADRIVAVSEDLGRQMSDIVGNPHKITVIPNLYHTNEIAKLSKDQLPIEYDFLNHKRFILNVGSLCHQKGQDDLLDIFSDVSKKFDDILLVIIGRGEWKDRLQQQSNTLHLKEKVIFIDFDINPYRYMARASLFVLTSRYEGFPNVLVEAMICNSPVVAFDCPTGPMEIIGPDSQYGILIKDRSIEDAVSGIYNLLSNMEFKQRMRNAGKERVKFFTADEISKKWIEVLR